MNKPVQSHVSTLENKDLQVMPASDPAPIFPRHWPDVAVFMRLEGECDARHVVLDTVLDGGAVWQGIDDATRALVVDKVFDERRRE